MKIQRIACDIEPHTVRQTIYLHSEWNYGDGLWRISILYWGAMRRWVVHINAHRLGDYATYKEAVVAAVDKLNEIGNALFGLEVKDFDKNLDAYGPLSTNGEMDAGEVHGLRIGGTGSRNDDR